MRTFWNAFYYPEDRRVRVSYYLGEEPWPGGPRLVKQIRSDHGEFWLARTQAKAGEGAAGEFLWAPPQEKAGEAAPRAGVGAPSASVPSPASRSTTSKSPASSTRS